MEDIFEKEIIEQVKRTQQIEKIAYKAGYKVGFRDGKLAREQELTGNSTLKPLQEIKRGICAICKGDYIEGVGHEQCYRDK